jgi:hypothetical protein
MKQELIDIVRKLKESQIRTDAYTDSIPSDIRLVVIENEYTNELQKQNEMLIESLFGEHGEEVFWFLYEFTLGRSTGPHIKHSDGTEYTFTTYEDYYNYLKLL